MQFRTDRMIARRKELNLTQEDLAERAAISQTTISQLETGKQAPSLNTLAVLSSTLGTSIDWLLGVTEEVAVPAHKLDELSTLEHEMITMLRTSDPKLRDEIVNTIRAIMTLVQAAKQ